MFNNVARYELTCVVCGKTFHAKHPLAKYCDEKCKLAARRQYEQKHYQEAKQSAVAYEKGDSKERLYFKTCAACGKQFITSCPTAKYCCDACRPHKKLKDANPDFFCFECPWNAGRQPNDIMFNPFL